MAFLRGVQSLNGCKRNIFSLLWAHSSLKGFSRDHTAESSLPIWLIIVDIFLGVIVISVSRSGGPGCSGCHGEGGGQKFGRW